MVPSAAALLIALVVALMPQEDARNARARLDVNGGGHCLSRDDIIRRVGTRSPHVRFADDAPLAATVALVSQRTGAVVVTLTLAAAGNEGAPRRVAARSCVEAADAVALILAVTLDPTARETPATVGAEPALAASDGSGTSSAPPTANASEVRAAPAAPKPAGGAVAPRASVTPPMARAPRRSTEPPRGTVAPAPSPVEMAAVAIPPSPTATAPLPAPDRATEPGMRWQLGGAAAGQAIFGVAPEVMPGIALSAMIAIDRDRVWSPALFVGWTHAWRSGLDQLGGTASFTLDAGTADACPLRWRWPLLIVRPCASLLVGRLTTRGSDTAQQATASRPFSAAGLTVNAGLGRTIELSARLGLGVTLIRDSYAFGDNVFYRAGAVTTSASLGLGARWP